MILQSRPAPTLKAVRRFIGTEMGGRPSCGPQLYPEVAECRLNASLQEACRGQRDPGAR